MYCETKGIDRETQGFEVSIVNRPWLDLAEILHRSSESLDLYPILKAFRKTQAFTLQDLQFISLVAGVDTALDSFNRNYHRGYRYNCTENRAEPFIVRKRELPETSFIRYGNSPGFYCSSYCSLEQLTPGQKSVLQSHFSPLLEALPLADILADCKASHLASLVADIHTDAKKLAVKLGEAKKLSVSGLLAAL